MSQTLTLAVSSGGPVPLSPRAGADNALVDSNRYRRSLTGKRCPFGSPPSRFGSRQSRHQGLFRHANRKKLADFSVRHRAVRLHIVAIVRIDHPQSRENKNGIKSTGASRDLRRHYDCLSGLSICNFVCRKQSNQHPERWLHGQFLHKNFHNENRPPNSHIDL